MAAGMLPLFLSFDFSNNSDLFMMRPGFPSGGIYFLFDNFLLICIFVK